MDSPTAVGFRSGSGPVSLREFLGVNGELRREKGDQTVVRISSLKSHVAVLEDSDTNEMSLPRLFNQKVKYISKKSLFPS